MYFNAPTDDVRFQDRGQKLPYVSGKAQTSVPEATRRNRLFQVLAGSGSSFFTGARWCMLGNQPLNKNAHGGRFSTT